MTTQASVPGESSRAFFDALAPYRAKDLRRHRVYYQDRLRWLNVFLQKDASIVELGCGIAPVLRHLTQEKKVGIDFSPEMLKFAKEADPKGEYIQDDVTKLTHHQHYDVVLLLDTINYLRDVQGALQNIRDHLCHNRTRVIITHWNFLWAPLFLVAEWIGIKTHFPEQNWLSRNDIRNLLTLTDFEVVEEGERMLFPVAIPLIARFCNKYLATFPLLRRLCVVKYMVARPMTIPRQEYSVTVLSAVRNEKGNISQIVNSMPVMGTSTEIIFAEGHSNDGTWEEIERISREHTGPVKVRGIKQTATGKANALHTGAAASTGDIILVYDGDFTVHPSELPRLYDLLASGKAEFVNASRLVYPMDEGAMRILNLLGNKTFSVLFSWLFRQKLVDTLSPVKMFFRAHYDRMDSRLDPFGDFDFFLGGSLQQLKMREVPVHYLPRTYGVTKIRRFRHGLLLGKLLLRGAKRVKWI